MSASSGPVPEPAQPKGFLRPCLLLLIAEAPAHGYELLDRLGAFGFERDPGGLYRALRSMERDGLLRSEWTLSSSGPGRRRYELTAAGRAHLASWAEALRHGRDLLDAYLERHGRVAGAVGAPRAGDGAR